METLAKAGLTNTQLEQLNACRMYLQATTLTKITDHTGTQLLPQALGHPTSGSLVGPDSIC